MRVYEWMCCSEWMGGEFTEWAGPSEVLLMRAHYEGLQIHFNMGGAVNDACRVLMLYGVRDQGSDKRQHFICEHLLQYSLLNL